MMPRNISWLRDAAHGHGVAGLTSELGRRATARQFAVTAPALPDDWLPGRVVDTGRHCSQFIGEADASPPIPAPRTFSFASPSFSHSSCPATLHSPPMPAPRMRSHRPAALSSPDRGYLRLSFEAEPLMSDCSFSGGCDFRLRLLSLLCARRQEAARACVGAPTAIWRNTGIRDYAGAFSRRGGRSHRQAR